MNRITCATNSTHKPTLLFRDLGFTRLVELHLEKPGRFVSDLVGNPEDRFSHIAAQF